MAGYIINLNDLTPAARVGMALAKWQKGAQSGIDPTTGYPIFPVTAEYPNFGGVSHLSTNHTLAASDNGKLLIFESASPATAYTCTLPTPSTLGGLSATFRCMVTNLSSNDVTLSGVTIDGEASLVLHTGQGCVLFTDGSSYFTEHGMGSGGGLTLQVNGTPNGSQTLLNLKAGTAITLTDDGTGGITFDASSFPYPVHAGVTLADGETLQYSTATGKFEPVTDKPTQPTSAVVGQPLAAQLVLIYTCATPMMFDANFSGSKGSVGANPAATATYTIYKNNVQCGTITISTSGVFTFASSGGAAVALNVGDRLTVTAPNPQDISLTDCGFTLVATRSSVFPPGQALPVYVFRNAYDNATTYQPYELVTYNGSTYLALSTTTGNVPSTAGVVDSHWAAIALAGAAGGVQLAQDIGGTTSTPLVIGLQGKALDATTVGNPSEGWGIVYEASSGMYKAKPVGNYPAAPTAYDDEFDATTLNAKWTKSDGGTAGTYAISNSRLQITKPAGTQCFCIFRQTKPTGEYQIDANMSLSASVWANYFGASMGFYDASTGKHVCNIYYFSTQKCDVNYWNNLGPSGYGGTNKASVSAPYVVSSFYMRIKDDGTNFGFWFSVDGLMWQPITTTVPRTEFMASYTDFFIGAYVDSNNPIAFVTVDWVRRTA